MNNLLSKFQAFRRWFRDVQDHEVRLETLNFDAEGNPVDGILELTRCGETRWFKIVDGRLTGPVEPVLSPSSQ